MAIAYARTSWISRSRGKNACEKAAYNGNCKIKDLGTNSSFNFSYMKSNVYHEILLPAYVNNRFNNVEVLVNEVEKAEKRKDSVLLCEHLLALPCEEEITLDHKIELTKRYESKLELTKNGLGVVIDIHKPSADDVNWYAKLLVTTRRFNTRGEFLENKKARDLELQIRHGKWGAFVPRGINSPTGAVWGIVQNDYFKEIGLSLRVKEVSEVPQEHIGLRKYGILAEQKRLGNVGS